MKMSEEKLDEKKNGELNERNYAEFSLQ